MKKKVLFICSYNSVRSQMAEGILRSIYPEKYVVYSAGLNSTGINPCAITVMKEIDIDIKDQYSKSIEDLPVKKFDYVVSVCNTVYESCPVYSDNNKHIHKGFSDPARINGTDTEILDAFRRVRDEIKEWIKEIF